MKLVERGIDKLINGNADGRVYLMRAPQNSSVPFIVFQRTDSDRVRSLKGPSGLPQATIQVSCYDKRMYGAKELAGQIEEILDGYRGTVIYDDMNPDGFVDIASISLQSDIDTIDETDEPVLFRNTMSFLVTYRQ